MASDIPRSGLDLIRLSEGLELKAYHGKADPPDIWTIGIGSILDLEGKPVTKDTPPITEEQAYLLLARGARAAWAGVLHWIPRPLNDKQRGALLDFAYNEGLGALQRSSLRQVILAGDVPDEEHWTRYRFSGRPPVERQGLIVRRKREHVLYLS